MSDKRSDEHRQSTTSERRKQPSSDQTGSGGERRSVNYRDRPSDDGKHGDAGDEPNSGFPRED